MGFVWGLAIWGVGDVETGESWEKAWEIGVEGESAGVVGEFEGRDGRFCGEVIFSVSLKKDHPVDPWKILRSGAVLSTPKHQKIGNFHRSRNYVIM